MNTKGTGAAFRESMAWTMCIAIAVAYPTVIAAVILDPTNLLRTAVLFGGLSVFLSVVPMVFGIFFAGSTEEEPNDERDRSIEQRSARFSHYVLGAGVLLTLGVVFLQQFILDVVESDDLLLHPLLSAHVLILFYAASECVRHATQGLDYRRGG